MRFLVVLLLLLPLAIPAFPGSSYRFQAGSHTVCLSGGSLRVDRVEMPVDESGGAYCTRDDGWTFTASKAGACLVVEHKDDLLLISEMKTKPEVPKRSTATKAGDRRIHTWKVTGGDLEDPQELYVHMYSCQSQGKWRTLKMVSNVRRPPQWMIGIVKTFVEVSVK